MSDLLIDNRLFEITEDTGETIVLTFKGFGTPLAPPAPPTMPRVVGYDRKQRNHASSPRSPHKPWTEEDDALLVRCYNNGQDYWSISRRLNRSQAAVSQRAVLLRKQERIS